MAGGADGFLDELTGDFVKHCRTAGAYVTAGGLNVPAVSEMVGTGEEARIFPEQARHRAGYPQIVYTQSGGETDKTHAGVNSCRDLILHVYAYSGSQPTANKLATALLRRWAVFNSGIIGDGTKLLVCNGSIVDSGDDDLGDSSDRKKFWKRLVLRMTISD